jgi:hypothetical protein
MQLQTPVARYMQRPEVRMKITGFRPCTDTRAAKIPAAGSLDVKYSLVLRCLRASPELR